MRRTFYDDRLEQHMEIINWKNENNYFAMNSMEKWVIYLQDRMKLKSHKMWYKIQHKIQQKMLMAIIGTPDIIKEKNIDSQNSLKVKYSAVKRASNCNAHNTREVI